MLTDLGMAYLGKPGPNWALPIFFKQSVFSARTPFQSFDVYDVLGRGMPDYESYAKSRSGDNVGADKNGGNLS